MIAGLGNPGKEYERTRHNTGFMVIDNLADRLSLRLDNNKFNALYTKIRISGEEVLIVKPQTFMNLSGEAIAQLAAYYRITPAEVLIIYDDFDLPLGKIRLRDKGSGGNHNGMKNIVLMLGTNEIKRIRIGLGRDRLIEQRDYVLGRFSEAEAKVLKQTVGTVTDALIDFPAMSFADLMNKYNPVHNE